MRYLIFIILLSSCSAAKLLQRSEKLKLMAIAKGAKVKVDTVYKRVEVPVEVPGFTASSSINVLTDSALVAAILPKYDSLLIAYNNLRSRPQQSTEAVVSTAKQLDAQRKKVVAGFLKDSLYHIKFDSLTSVDLAIIGGKPKLVGVRVKPRSILVEKEIPIGINETTKAGFTLWQMIGAGFAGVVLAGVVIGIFVWLRIRRQEIQELKQRNV
jgi:hypothetical protein